jgi:hypothetical protein
MSSATGAPVLPDNACSFLSWSSFKKRAVRFMPIQYHTGIHMSIVRQFGTFRTRDMVKGGFPSNGASCDDERSGTPASLRSTEAMCSLRRVKFLGVVSIVFWLCAKSDDEMTQK